MRVAGVEVRDFCLERFAKAGTAFESSVRSTRRRVAPLVCSGARSDRPLTLDGRPFVPWSLTIAMTMGEASQPRTISKGRLKARMLEVFREIERKGEKLIVTDNGKPVLLIEPIRAKREVDELFADLRGKVEYAEDINAPTTDEWAET